jgi:hypothetical protein
MKRAEHGLEEPQSIVYTIRPVVYALRSPVAVVAARLLCGQLTREISMLRVNPNVYSFATCTHFASRAFVFLEAGFAINDWQTFMEAPAI